MPKYKVIRKSLFCAAPNSTTVKCPLYKDTDLIEEIIKRRAKKIWYCKVISINHETREVVVKTIGDD